MRHDAGAGAPGTSSSPSASPSVSAASGPSDAGGKQTIGGPATTPVPAQQPSSSGGGVTAPNPSPVQAAGSAAGLKEQGRTALLAAVLSCVTAALFTQRWSCM